MHLVKNDEFNVTNQVRAFVEHTSQNLRRHDETVRFRVDLNIACEDTNLRCAECLLEVSVLLV